MIRVTLNINNDIDLSEDIILVVNKKSDTNITTHTTLPTTKTIINILVLQQYQVVLVQLHYKRRGLNQPNNNGYLLYSHTP